MRKTQVNVLMPESIDRRIERVMAVTGRKKAACFCLALLEWLDREEAALKSRGTLLPAE